MIFCLLAVIVASCSTKKNTGVTRFWHAFNARYNTYFNGAQAYIDASLEKEKGNKDNFTELLPLYTVGNKASRDLGKANYDIAITKAQKDIQIHSIKTKPAWNKDRRKTEKDLEWLSRKEYNPFIWKAWMLMGRSQFYKGEFDEAAATFNYMSRLYKTQPPIFGKAQAWLAKCYIESDWIYSAEDVIRNMQRDSVDWRAKKEWDYTLCDYYLHTGDLALATRYMHKVIKHEMRSKQRAREYYILGQIEAAQGHREEAFKAFKKVLRQHPDYEHRFNATISMTEVMAQTIKSGKVVSQAKQMIARLKRMARNDNNAEYLDQVYYAIGNIYLAEKDTTKAIEAYETGNKKATRSGIEKGVLLLHLGDLYWAKEKFGDAKRCYGEAIGLLDKDRKDYAQLSERSKVLDELVPYTDAIELQDSLQMLSKLPQEELYKKIDKIIEEVKKKEKEEANKKWDEEQAKNGNANGNNEANNANNNNSTNNTAKSSSSSLIGDNNATIWYFYSPTAVQKGKQLFINQWGKRENKDDWQRSNKTVVGNVGATEDVDQVDSITQARNDSIVQAEDSIKARLDSAVNNPHKREYYLAQIPFTDEQKLESDKIIMDGLFHSAIIFKDKLDNLPLSEKAFRRLETQYPGFEPKDEAYYHLFLLYSRKGEHDTAQRYVDSLKTKCPDSQWTTIVTDPYFRENAQHGKELEDSLYASTYNAFKTDKFKEVYDNEAVSEHRFPLGANRDRFIFIDGLTKLNEGKIAECMTMMEKVVKDYPQSVVSEMAGMIINGVKAGRRIYGAKFDLADVWNRRTGVFSATDSLTAKKLSKERNTDFLVVLAYNPDSLGRFPSGTDNNAENQLLFQLARYNFTNFLVRNFDITIDNSQGMHHMTVSGFQNFDEARQYSRMLSAQESIRKAAKGARLIVISKDNLDLIGQQYSYNDYDTFYIHHFAPLSVIHAGQLYEPVVEKKKEEDKSAANDKTDEPKRERLDAEGNPIDDDPVKPILPDEEVAPKGVKPVDPNAKDELNDENSIAIPQSFEIDVKPQDSISVAPQDSITVTPQSTISVAPQDSVTVTPQNMFEIVPDVPLNRQTEEIIIPDVPVKKSTEDFVIPEVTEPKKQTTDDILIIEDNKPQKQKQTTDDILIIEDNKPQQQKQTTDDILIIEDNKPQQQKQTTDDILIIEDNKPKQQKNTKDDIIIIDDGSTRSPQAKKSLEKVEDEYYELDGF